MLRLRREGGSLMNNGFLIFAGLLITMAWSWYGIIFKNFNELGRIEPVKMITGEAYPGGRTGTAHHGQEIYRANGCASCHTMQVRMKGYGADIERGWGKRNSVMQDFVYDQHVFLGQARVGPDLANIGSRNASVTWHLLHLYNPRITVPDSMMPQYPYLFQKHKIGLRPSPNALVLPENFRQAGYEIIPTRDAVALAEYLASLNGDTPLFEAPLMPPPAPSQGTNSSGAAAAPSTQK